MTQAMTHELVWVVSAMTVQAMKVQEDVITSIIRHSFLASVSLPHAHPHSQALKVLMFRAGPTFKTEADKGGDGGGGESDDDSDLEDLIDELM